MHQLQRMQVTSRVCLMQVKQFTLYTAEEVMNARDSLMVYISQMLNMI